MEPFKAIQEPDEGYSEHPLYPSGTSGNGASTALTGVQSHSDLPAWLSSQLPSLSISQKTRELSSPYSHNKLPFAFSGRVSAYGCHDDRSISRLYEAMYFC